METNGEVSATRGEFVVVRTILLLSVPHDVKKHYE